jgi:hypothetical protein
MESNIIQLGGPHYKICKCGCKTEFNGRRNQKYFPKHKAKVNNKAAAKRREKLSPTFRKMEKCYSILVKIRNLNLLDQWIPITDLTRDGFDPNIPSNSIKTKKDGTEYYKLADFAFRLSDDASKIIIHQIKL